MKPENILQSDVLDIIFENKNKAYGAYELRKTYNNRLTKAIGVTASLVVLAVGLQSFMASHKTEARLDDKKGVVVLCEWDLSKPIEKPLQPKPKEQRPQQQQASAPKTAQAQYTKPIIVPNDQAIKPMSTIDQLTDKNIGTTDIDGPPVQPGVHPGVSGIGDGPGTSPTGTGEDKVEAPEVTGPLTFAQFMPEFPGGREALIKYMQRNLFQPDDIPEGEKIVVMAQFVVDAEGNIAELKIVKDGRDDLDKEVLRVIKRMPKWKPGMQNGRAVPVYFKLPVTFVSE